MKIIKRMITFLLIVVLIAGGVFLLKKRKEEWSRTPSPEKRPVVLESFRVKRGSLETGELFTGSSIGQPVNTVNVETKVAGYIEKITCTNRRTKLGKKGQFFRCL
ncbi:MAG: hypothetical protein Q9M89_04585 [Persephonella sp.]|nr:hypothetical protein [Persephonella sp.]